MNDIFISYKREDQATARNLAIALESEGFTVWWDRELRGGDYFDDVIQKQLNEARCVIVIWSESSVQSQYVKAEAAYAQDHGKLIPVRIDSVTLPIRFRLIHTLSLLGWDGSKDFSELRRLVGDISSILGPTRTTLAVADAQRRLEREKSPNVEKERFREQERQRSEEEARRKANKKGRRTYGPVAAAVALALILFSFVFWWLKPQEGRPKGKVFFSEPKDGAVINGPVKVVMVVEGMEVKPAGEVVEGTGHHHILINKDFIPPGQVIPLRHSKFVGVREDIKR
jgi:TIR domain/Domain of unknown function (DUF4399)